MVSRGIQILALLSGLLLAAPVLAGGADERPRIADYEDPEKFVQDVLAWERKQRRNETDSNSDSEENPEHAEHSERKDLYDIDGPETLDEALRKARGYTPPDYEAKYRFNRTTHLSFPLPRLEGEQMSGKAVTGGLSRKALEQRSLKPLPEMRMILEETDDGELSASQKRQSLPSYSSLHRQAVQIDNR